MVQRITVVLEKRQEKKNSSVDDRFFKVRFGAVHDLHSTVYWLNLYTPRERVLSIAAVEQILALSSAFQMAACSMSLILRWPTSAFAVKIFFLKVMSR